MSVVMADPEPVHERVTQWYAESARDLPWRDENCSAWGVMVSEVMLQQTPVVRVLPRWEEWMRRWPTPAATAAAPASEILTVWDRLGYPRRALRLQSAARAMVEHHAGEVPTHPEQLLALPGVGEYTAAAVACFAFGEPELVVDTNIRRVHARVFRGEALPGPTYTAAQRRLARDLMPDTRHDDGALACAWNASAMELGALICTARSPACAQCPVQDLCAWVAAGSPEPTDAQRGKGQAWAGTDRQVRGAIMSQLRRAAERHRAAEASEGSQGPGVERSELLETLPLPKASTEQRQRCLDSLVADGLAVSSGERIALPGLL